MPRKLIADDRHDQRSKIIRFAVQGLVGPGVGMFIACIGCSVELLIDPGEHIGLAVHHATTDLGRPGADALEAVVAQSRDGDSNKL